ncbi:hypothetical protein EZS27_009355 [termite gut metagenome]|uniref:Uncharacterized protein n=1 Tax=termite gut metagenome TaxID=433724 RepID=A0A5J4SBR8_9ZZZZ
MKNNCIFAEFNAKEHKTKGCSYFYGYFGTVICKDKKVIKSQWLHRFRCNCSLARMGGDNLSYFNILNFSFIMPKNNENASRVNNSNAQARTAHETGKTQSIKIFESPNFGKIRTVIVNNEVLFTL